MADIDIDPFGGMEHPASGEHGRTDEPMDEHIPLSPRSTGWGFTSGVLVTPGGSTWEPE